MNWTTKNYGKEDFSRVRQFLIDTYSDYDVRCNWGIERLNFAFSVASIRNHGLEFMYETIMLWEDESHKIISIVINEGEMKGEVFFQLRRDCINEKLLNEMFEYAQGTSYTMKDGKRFMRLMIPTPYDLMKNLAVERGYKKADWVDYQTVIFGNVSAPKGLPEGFSFTTGDKLSNKEIAQVHALAFGYIDDAEKIALSEIAYDEMSSMHDYNPHTDMYVLTPDGKPAAFACMWYDDINKNGMLEPLGTSPKYRRMGLGSIVLHEAIRRINEMGAMKSYGGNQKFIMILGSKLK